MKPFNERLERIEVEELVHIPTLDGDGIADTIKIKVPALRDPKDGEIYYDSEATALLDKVKARHLGLLTPEHIHCLRERLGLTQREVSELLQIGEKTWTRWETGRERPSRSINVLLCALNDGRIDIAYLRNLARRRNDWTSLLANRNAVPRNPWLDAVKSLWQHWEPDETGEIADALCRAVTASIIPGDAQSEFFPHFETVLRYKPQPYTTTIRVQHATSAFTLRPAKEAEPELAVSQVPPEDALAA